MLKRKMLKPAPKIIPCFTLQEILHLMPHKQFNKMVAIFLKSKSSNDNIEH